MRQNHILKLKKYLLFFCLSVFAVTYITGCDDDTMSPNDPVVQNAYLSFTHTSPDAPSVDVYIGSNLFAANVAYLQTIQYLTLLTGNNQVLVYAAGTSNLLIDTTVFLQANQFYSIFAIDSLQSIEPLFLNDDLTSPGSTNCNARFINLAPGAPAYDVQAVGKSIWFPNYSYGVVSGFRALSFGLYDIQVKLVSNSTVVVDSPNNSLTQGSIYTFITNGFPGATGTQALGFTVIKNFQNSLGD